MNPKGSGLLLRIVTVEQLRAARALRDGPQTEPWRTAAFVASQLSSAIEAERGPSVSEE